MPLVIEYSLIENAMDYLDSAAEAATPGGSGASKYGVLHLVAGIELLLKARLNSEHWGLVFKDVDKASRIRLASGDFLSVEMEAAIARLEQICDVQFNQSDKDLLADLRKLRNRIQHFSVKIEHAALMALLGFGYHFAIRFIEDHLNDIINVSRVQTLNLKLSGFKDYSSHRMVSIKNVLELAPLVLSCIQCFQPALVIGNGDPHCAFCGFTVTPRQLADEMPGDYEDECPECNGPCTMYFIDSTGSKWHCFQCGIEGDYTKCARCGSLYDAGFVSGESGGEICRECWKELAANSNA